MHLFHKILNKNIKKEEKLRQFSLKYRIQFGKILEFKKKISKKWLKARFISKIYIKLKKKTHYRTLRAVPILRFYKYCSAFYKILNLKLRLFWLNEYLGLSLLKKIKKIKELNIRARFKKIRKGAKYRYFGQRKYIYSFFRRFVKESKKRMKLKGKLVLLNFWIFFFHRKNLKLLQKTITFENKKSFSIFRKLWNYFFFKEKYLIYNWLSFFLFRVAYLGIEKLVHNYTSPFKLKLLIGISEKQICFFLQLINNYLKILHFLLYQFYKIKKKKSSFLDIYIGLKQNRKRFLIKKHFFRNRSKRNIKNFQPLINKFFQNLLIKDTNRERYSNVEIFQRLLKFLVKKKLNLFSINSSLLVEKCIFKFINMKRKKTKVVTKFLIRLVTTEQKIDLFKTSVNLINNNTEVSLKDEFKFFGLSNHLNIFFNKNKKNIAFCKHLYSWLFWIKDYNLLLFERLFKPYNIWFFYINYSVNYYLFSKLYFVFFNYFFFIICQKFKEIQLILRLKGFELGYEFIKYKDNSRYYLGMKPHTFITTFNRRLKKGLQY